MNCIGYWTISIFIIIIIIPVTTRLTVANIVYAMKRVKHKNHVLYGKIGKILAIATRNSSNNSETISVMLASVTIKQQLHHADDNSACYE